MSFDKKYVKVFSNCIPVKGASRSVLCDVHKGDVRLIPNALYNLFPFFDTINKEDILAFYGDENIKIVQEYIDFLIESKSAFCCPKEDLECFPLIDISEFHTPFAITNAIIELGKVNAKYLLNVIDELNSVLCQALEIRLTDKIELLELKLLLSLFNTPHVHINELHIIVPENNDWSLDTIKKEFDNHQRLTSIIICDASKEEHHVSFFGDNSAITYTHRSAYLPGCCGNFVPGDFITNLPFFTESQHYNTCLNRKLAIDIDGNIKNCPSLPQSFGNIKEVKLIDVIENKEFSKKWYINKDQIKVCQDCEFRHVCMDCRAYLEDPEDLYSKPLKCGYNPYTMEWEEWSTNPLKQKAIQHYDLKDL